MLSLLKNLWVKLPIIVLTVTAAGTILFRSGRDCFAGGLPLVPPGGVVGYGSPICPTSDSLIGGYGYHTLTTILVPHSLNSGRIKLALVEYYGWRGL